MKPTFGIADYQDYFKFLTDRHDSYQKDILSIDNAIFFSITAHHFYKDWLPKMYPDKSIVEKVQFEYTSALKVESEIIREICDGFKHGVLNKPPWQRIEMSYRKQGAFSSAFSRDFAIECLLIKTQSGEEIYFEDVANKVFTFWKNWINNVAN